MRTMRSIFALVIVILLLISSLGLIYVYLNQDAAPSDSSASTLKALECGNYTKENKYYDFESELNPNDFTIPSDGSVTRADVDSDSDIELTFSHGIPAAYIYLQNNQTLNSDFRTVINIQDITFDNANAGLSLKSPTGNGIRYFVSRNEVDSRLRAETFDADGNTSFVYVNGTGLTQNTNIILGIERLNNTLYFYSKLANSANEAETFIQSVYNDQNNLLLSDFGMSLFPQTAPITTSSTIETFYSIDVDNIEQSYAYMDDFLLNYCSTNIICTNDSMCESGQVCEQSQCITDPIANNPVRVMTINYNPLDANGLAVADKYFKNSFKGLTALNYTQSHFKQLRSILSTVTDSTRKFSIVHNFNIDKFQANTDGFRFTPTSYSKCVAGRSNYDEAYCEATKIKFDYDRWIRSNQICEKVEQYDIDVIWMYSLPFTTRWESFIIGPTNTIMTNGGSYISNTCKRHVAVINGTYDVPNLFLHSFGHHVERILLQMSIPLKAEDKDKYFENFFNIQGSYSSGTPTKSIFCGNTHFPFNSTSAYEVNATRLKRNNCASISNFPNVTQITSDRLNCTAWKCDILTADIIDQEWQKYWLSYIPSNSGTTELIAFNDKSIPYFNNWWYYIFEIDNIIRLRNSLN